MFRITRFRYSTVRINRVIRGTLILDDELRIVVSRGVMQVQIVRQIHENKHFSTNKTEILQKGLLL